MAQSKAQLKRWAWITVATLLINVMMAVALIVVIGSEGDNSSQKGQMITLCYLISMLVGFFCIWKAKLWRGPYRN